MYLERLLIFISVLDLKREKMKMNIFFFVRLLVCFQISSLLIIMILRFVFLFFSILVF